jgi:hypothetical protein
MCCKIVKRLTVLLLVNIPINRVSNSELTNYLSRYQLTRENMVTSPKGLGPEKDYAGEGQQNTEKTEPSSRQRGRPRKTVTVNE